MKNEDQSHTVASMHYGLFGDPSSKLTGSIFRKRPILPLGHASNDKRSADISSLDNLSIKSLRPSIIRGCMNDT